MCPPIVERHAEVVPVAVDELDVRARSMQRERRRHECVRRAEDGSATQLEELERGKRRAGPAGGRDPGQAVPGGPGPFEGACERPIRPLLVVERLVPERVQALAVTMIEPDGEGVDVHSSFPASPGPAPVGRRPTVTIAGKSDGGLKGGPGISAAVLQAR